jgi:transcriptional regulator with XRE-family HTH domain
VFLRLVGEIEGQLREGYHRRSHAGQLNQSSLAEKLDVGRSVISRRLNGQTNMTIETIADMAWALDLEIEITIRDKPAVGAVSAASDRFGDAIMHPVKPLAAERSRH